LSLEHRVLLVGANTPYEVASRYAIAGVVGDELFQSPRAADYRLVTLTGNKKPLLLIASVCFLDPPNEARHEREERDPILACKDDSEDDDENDDSIHVQGGSPCEI